MDREFAKWIVFISQLYYIFIAIQVQKGLIACMDIFVPGKNLAAFMQMFLHDEMKNRKLCLFLQRSLFRFQTKVPTTDSEKKMNFKTRSTDDYELI